MGMFFSSLLNRFYCVKKPYRIVMFGLDNAGKTSILYRLKLGECVRTINTIAFNVETVRYRNVEFTVWDVGGGDKIRPLWRCYCENTHAIIFVIDSSDSQRLDEASEELTRLLSEYELRDTPVLVFANKQDLPKAFGITEIGNKLAFKANSTRKCYIQECCATTGAGIYEGLEWLSNNLNNLSLIMKD